MQLDLNRVAQELGWAILHKLAAEQDVKRLEAENAELMRAFERGDEPGQDHEGDGNQGA